MKAVILAAGAGRRLAESGWTKPKCLLPCPGGTLLDHAMNCLAARGVEEVAVVVGHRRELVEQAARSHSIRSHFVENADYATTNTMHSLWLARGHLDGDVFLFNADVWFDAGVLDRLAGVSESALAIDESSRDAEAVKVVADGDGRITRIGKELPAESCLGEFVGIARFDRRFCVDLVESLRMFNEEPRRRHLYFESAVDAILGRCRLMAVPLGELRAIEIDTPRDLARAETMWRSERPTMEA